MLAARPALATGRQALCDRPKAVPLFKRYDKYYGGAKVLKMGQREAIHESDP